MRIFYGSAIQGAKDRSERAHIHRALIGLIKSKGHEVVSEHATGESKEEAAELLHNVLTNNSEAALAEAYGPK